MEKILYPELLGEMAKHGDTQKSLAKLLGITYSSVSRRLSGKSEWSISEIDILCEHYGKNYYELFKKNEKE
jgi:predicted transcriptional regulator